MQAFGLVECKLVCIINLTGWSWVNSNMVISFSFSLRTDLASPLHMISLQKTSPTDSLGRHVQIEEQRSQELLSQTSGAREQYSVGLFPDQEQSPLISLCNPISTLPSQSTSPQTPNFQSPLLTHVSGITKISNLKEYCMVATRVKGPM